jgi:purine-binding chemotaxis protein CheW
MENNVLYDDTGEDTQKNKYLTFSLEEEHFGLEIEYVTEIVGIQPITTIPEMPVFVKGVINLRGDIIPVMDARIRFSKNPIKYNDRTCIVVIDVNAVSIGIVVDAVNEVMTIEEENIVPPPLIFKGNRNYIKAIGKQDDLVTLLLDCNNMLDNDELDEIASI